MPKYKLPNLEETFTSECLLQISFCIYFYFCRLTVDTFYPEDEFSVLIQTLCFVNFEHDSTDLTWNFLFL